MSDPGRDGLASVVERTNETVVDSVERTIEGQVALAETFGRFALGEGTVDDGVSDYVRASETVLEGFEELSTETIRAVNGEDLQPGTLRDVWLQSINDTLSELMSTGTFAAVDEQFVDTVLGAQFEVDELTQDSLSQAGFSTRRDTAEIVDRLVELEHRQQELEEKLDAVLDAVEDRDDSA